MYYNYYGEAWMICRGGIRVELRCREALGFVLVGTKLWT